MSSQGAALNKAPNILIMTNTCSPLGYERVYLPLWEVADTPFHIQGNDVVPGILFSRQLFNTMFSHGANT